MPIHLNTARLTLIRGRMSATSRMRVRDVRMEAISGTRCSIVILSAR